MESTANKFFKKHLYKETTLKGLVHSCFVISWYKNQIHVLPIHQQDYKQAQASKIKIKIKSSNSDNEASAKPPL